MDVTLNLPANTEQATVNQVQQSFTNANHSQKTAIEEKDQTDMKEKLRQVVEQVNGQLKNQSEIVFHYDEISHRIWLNIIEKTTGKVLAEIPAEVIRKIEDGYSGHTGLIFDKKS